MPFGISNDGVATKYRLKKSEIEMVEGLDNFKVPIILSLF